MGQDGRNLSALFTGFGRPLELVESDVPRPGGGEVVVRIAHVGICGTELHYLFSRPWESDPDSPVEVTNNLGFVGHEYSATIEEVGPGVSGWAKGDPVVGVARLPCHRCPQCHASELLCCTQQWRPTDKAYAKYMLLRVEQLHRVPPNVDLRLAALASPLAECLHGLDAAVWGAGMTALVAGAGPMGLFTILLLLHSGAASVVVSEPNEGRRELARSLGAIAVAPEEAIETAMQLTGGTGLDTAFECVGAVPAFDTAFRSVRKGGRLVLIGLAPESARYEMNLLDLWRRRVTIAAGGGLETTLDRALRCLPRLGAERLIAGEFPLVRVNEAFESAHNGAPGKVLVTPWS